MGVLLLFAFLSGIITILSPCILPVLPIVLSGSVGKGKARPFGVITGFVISFTLFTLALTTIVRVIGIPADSLRILSVVLITLFGLVLVVPFFGKWFEIFATKIANIGKKGRGLKSSSAASGKPQTEGFLSGTLVGASLGLVWTPCVGPIMASVISLALTESVDSGALFITLAYAIGTSIPMLLVMLGGRKLLNKVPFLMRNTAKIQKVFGVLLIAVGISIAFGWDRQLQTAILSVIPQYGTGLTSLENTSTVTDALKSREGKVRDGDQLKASFDTSTQPKNGTPGDYGPAPTIVANGKWFNTAVYDISASMMPEADLPSLTMEKLRGKVVVLDFWTYSCINCIRTIPVLKSWYEKYNKYGLEIVGIHTPEFEFEKNADNVSKAIKDLGITWPVVQDNDYKQWNAYSNKYWPAHYFIDTQGNIRYFHFGEGHYKESEKVIVALLREAGLINDLEKSIDTMAGTNATEADAGTPETYLGYGRGRRFVSAVSPVADTLVDYQPLRTPENGEWNLEGEWTIAREHIVPDTSGTLQLGFFAKNVFLVAEPLEPGTSILVRLDNREGVNTIDVKNGVLSPDKSRLYQLVGLENKEHHLLTLKVKGKIRLFAFTFG